MEELSTYLDFVGAEGVHSTPRPACLKTHLPFGKLPYSPEAKYIYITRNPYDCCVSFYYHTRSLLLVGRWAGTLSAPCCDQVAFTKVEAK
ncbi:hypothetical protein MTO96_025219 [Rhipicephalus appendiculatus]